jgi:hypothetical protein
LGSKTLGPFPKKHRWSQLLQSAGGDPRLSDLLLESLQERYASFVDDEMAKATVVFLVALVVGTRSTAPTVSIAMTYGFNILGDDESEFIAALRTAVPVEHPFRDAAEQTIGYLLDRHRESADLFGQGSWHAWRQYDSSAFCDLARLFFSFLNRRMFSEILSEHALRVESPELDRFASEMSLITRTFSARWFNACARKQTPDEGSIHWYLAHCLGKLDLELAREHSLWREPTGNPWKRRKNMSRTLSF